jgi:hypothetical protein
MSRKAKAPALKPRPRRKSPRRSSKPVPQTTPAARRAALEAQMERKGIKPIDDPDTMTADFWPADETADEVIEAVRALRRRTRRGE